MLVFIYKFLQQFQAKKMKRTTPFILMLLIFQIPDCVFAKGERRDAMITMQYQKTDSTHVIYFEVTDRGKHPVKDVTINVFIKRMFGMMKMDDVFTDSIGKGSLSFSNRLPGSDSLTNIFVIAKIEGDKQLNDTSAQIIIKSVIPYQQSQQLERSTFSNRAPIWLIFTFSILFGGVWIMYLKVILMIRKIKKAGTAIS